MDWRKNLKTRWQKDVSNMEQAIEWMQSRKMETGEVDRAGNLTDLTQESIAYYERIVADLKALIAKIDRTPDTNRT